MKPILHNRPNFLLETIVLLYLCHNVADFQQLPLLAKVVWPSGEDPVSFFKQHEQMYIAYLRAYQKREHKDADASVFLEDLAVSDYVLTILPFLIDANLVYDAEERDAPSLLELLDRGFVYLWENGGALFDVTQYNNFSAYLAGDACGDALRTVAHDPCRYLTKLAQLIRQNIPAAESAWDVVRQEAQAFFDQYWANGNFFERSVWRKDAPVRHIYPMISTYSSSFLLEDTYYCGLFNIDVRTEQERTEARDSVLALCKALGDKKRLEMLLLFRERPYFNRELANLLHLSPATVMHHIDVLLGCGLLKMMKQEENQKRVYFSLEENRLSFLLTQLQQLFGLYPSEK